MSKMTVGELIEMLQGFDEDAEVRLAQQPRWAFEYSVGTIAAAAFEGDEPDEPNNVVVYIGEGQQLRYLPDEAAKALDW